MSTATLQREQRVDELEQQTAHTLDDLMPGGGYAAVRVDGRAFHTYTRGLTKPYSDELIAAMDHTAQELAREISGAVLVYTQSDEINALFTNLHAPESQWWFGGVIRKATSVAASLATAAFNRHRHDDDTRRGSPPAQFDARVTPLPTAADAREYVRWRQGDAVRNAVNSLAHHYYGHARILGVSHRDRLRMLEDSGVRLTDVDLGFLRGRMGYRVTTTDPVRYWHKGRGEWVEEDVGERAEWWYGPAPDLRTTGPLEALMPDRRRPPKSIDP